MLRNLELKLKMKSKDLIKYLQQNDPDGDAEVYAGGQPIDYVDDPMPWWYDGRAMLMEKDVYGKVSYVGWGKNFKKLHLVGFDLENFLMDNPEFPIDLSGITQHSDINNFKEMIEKYREQGHLWKKTESNFPLMRNPNKFGLKQIKNEEKPTKIKQSSNQNILGKIWKMLVK